MKNKIASIYKITNIINNKCYIGITKTNPSRRWYNHKNKIQQEYQKQKILYRAFNKYGLQNFTFEVICQTLDLDYGIKELEPYFIKQYHSHYSESGYNATWGGDGIWGYKFTKEQREKLSLSAKKRRETAEGIQHKEKLRQIVLGKKKSAQTLKKVSKSLKKYYENNVHWGIGISHTEEHKQKISATLKGRRLSDQCYKAGSENESEWWIITFPDKHTEQIKNLKQFAKDHNLSPQCLWLTTKGKTKQTQGYSAKKLSNPPPTP